MENFITRKGLLMSLGSSDKKEESEDPFAGLTPAQRLKK
jgi:hypothetical protein